MKTKNVRCECMGKCLEKLTLMKSKKDSHVKMRIFGLYITTIKRHEEDNALLAKSLEQKLFLQKSTEKLLTIVKGSRQVRRGAERRLAKTGN